MTAVAQPVVEDGIEVIGRRATLTYVCLNCGEQKSVRLWRRYVPGPFCSDQCRAKAMTRPLPWTSVND